MEIQKERVLAYTLAKVMNQNELSEVSGGGGGLWCHDMTVQASGSNGNMDTILDVHLDW